MCALLVLTAALSTGCGFHPRGSVFPSGDPGRLFVDADRGLSIEETLRQALRERDFVLVSERDAADVVLRVSNEQQTRRIVSVRSTGRVSEFELAHAVNMRIDRTPAVDSGSDGAVDATPVEAVSASADRVVVRREYTYDESQVLGKENEARILRLEMSEELVRQVVLRTIASLAPREVPDDVPSSGRESGTAQ